MPKNIPNNHLHALPLKDHLWVIEELVTLFPQSAKKWFDYLMDWHERFDREFLSIYRP